MDTLLSELLRLQQQNEQQAQEQAQAHDLLLKLVELLLQQSQTTPIPAPTPECAVSATIGLSTPPNTITTTTPSNTPILHNATPATTTTAVQQKTSPNYHDFSNEMPPPDYCSPTDLDSMCFAEKLHYLLSQEETETKTKIGWRPHGRAFKIHVPDLFATQVCPKYFGHRSIARFRKNLLDHGFKRIPNGRDEGGKVVSFAELEQTVASVHQQKHNAHMFHSFSCLFFTKQRLLP